MILVHAKHQRKLSGGPLSGKFGAFQLKLDSSLRLVAKRPPTRAPVTFVIAKRSRNLPSAGRFPFLQVLKGTTKVQYLKR